MSSSAGNSCFSVRDAGPFSQGMIAARANIVPGALLWAIGLFVVLSYYFWPQAEGVFTAVGDLKVRYGFRFAALSTALFAGVLPFLFQKLQVGNVRPAPWRHLPFMVLFWGVKGVEVDALYRLQALIFGDAPDFGVVVSKVFVDQFVYCPVWAVPSMVLVYLWKDSGFSFRLTLERLGSRWYYRRILPVMISNWSVWIPAVTFIYLLPQPLQLPLQNIVVCFWVLLLMVLTADDREGSPGAELPGGTRPGRR